MKKPRTLQFAATGAVISLVFVAIGHRMDAAVPAITLDHQVLYNWLGLVLSPASFFLRFTDPDAPIVGSLSFAATVIAINAMWYAAARHLYLGVLQLSSTTSSVTLPAIAAAAGSSSQFSIRSGSPSERLAARYEHGLSAKQPTEALVDDAESVALSGSSLR